MEHARLPRRGTECRIRDKCEMYKIALLPCVGEDESGGDHSDQRRVFGCILALLPAQLFLLRWMTYQGSDPFSLFLLLLRAQRFPIDCDQAFKRDIPRLDHPLGLIPPLLQFGYFISPAARIMRGYRQLICDHPPHKFTSRQSWRRPMLR